MRRYARTCLTEVTRRVSDSRPIHLRIGADTYGMAFTEAIDLANQLIDAVEQGDPTP